jgi:hypothetical protein
MWRRIVNFLSHRKGLARSEAVNAVFAQNLRAQVRAGEAAADVTRSSDRTRHRLERLRQEIAERNESDRRERPQPPTSDVRHLVERTLARVEAHQSKKG